MESDEGNASEVPPSIDWDAVALSSGVDPSHLLEIALGAAIQCTAGDDQLAEDIACKVRDSIMVMLDAQPDFVRDGNNLPGFIQRSVRNAFRDYCDAVEVRRKARDTVVFELGLQRSPQVDPVKILENKELGADINAAVQALPLRLKQVWCLRYLNRAEYKLISEILGIGIETAKKYKKEANAKLQVLLKHHRPDFSPKGQS